ncbi:MAG: Crp/Fnr family transcriptional regulator [Paludibacteraceae bacterium]|nr:Crp/Fnr family transcriptional regulator [Paludibacteraceae bacterium]
MVIGSEEKVVLPGGVGSLWDTLTESEREYVIQHIETLHYDKNEVIHLDGEEPYCVWIVISGKVRIYKEGVGQRHQIIRLLKPYDMFGYRAVVADERHNTSASAFEDCVLYRLGKEYFNHLIRSNGQFCYAMMQKMAKNLALSENRTLSLTQKHVRGRLADSLLLLLKNYGYAEDGQTLAMRLSREDLANLSNMTTANAIRTLSEFQQEGLVAVNGRHIQICNLKELEHISHLG